MRRRKAPTPAAFTWCGVWSVPAMPLPPLRSGDELICRHLPATPAPPLTQRKAGAVVVVSNEFARVFFPDSEQTLIFPANLPRGCCWFSAAHSRCLPVTNQRCAQTQWTLTTHRSVSFSLSVTRHASCIFFFFFCDVRKDGSVQQRKPPVSFLRASAGRSTTKGSVCLSTPALKPVLLPGRSLVFRYAARLPVLRAALPRGG